MSLPCPGRQLPVPGPRDPHPDARRAPRGGSGRAPEHRDQAGDAADRVRRPRDARPLRRPCPDPAGRGGSVDHGADPHRRARRAHGLLGRRRRGARAACDLRRAGRVPTTRNRASGSAVFPGHPDHHGRVRGGRTPPRRRGPRLDDQRRGGDRGAPRPRRGRDHDRLPRRRRSGPGAPAGLTSRGVVDPDPLADYGPPVGGRGWVIVTVRPVMRLRSPERAAVVGFAIALVMLALVVGMSSRQLGRLRDASRDVERSGEIAGHVELLRSYLRDAESAERGFVITGERSQLEPYKVATAMLAHEIETLRHLMREFPRQQPRLKHVERAIRGALSQFVAIIRIRRTDGFEAARQALQNTRGEQLLETTHAATRHMADAQRRLLRSRGEARLAALRSTMWWVAFASALAFALLATATCGLVVIQRRRARALEELKESQRRLRLAAVEREDLLRREQAARAEAEPAAIANAESLTLLEHAERERAAAASRRQAAHDIGAVAASHLDLEELLQSVMGRLREALAVDAVIVLLLDEDGATLRVRASLGLEDEARACLAVPVGYGIAGRIAASGTPLVVDDLSTVEVWSDVLQERMRSLMGVPLLVAGRLIGVVHVATALPRRFTDEDLHLLELVAGRVASAIEHARLFAAERQARTEAEAANRAKDEFLGTLSHELRSPLSAIRTWVHLLRRGTLDQAKTERALATIEESAKLQAQLIEDLLDVSRIVSGKFHLDAHPVDLAAVIEAAIDTVRFAADAKEI